MAIKREYSGEDRPIDMLILTGLIDIQRGKKHEEILEELWCIRH